MSWADDGPQPNNHQVIVIITSKAKAALCSESGCGMADHAFARVHGAPEKDLWRIALDPDLYDQVHQLARTWNCTDSEAIVMIITQEKPS